MRTPWKHIPMNVEDSLFGLKKGDRVMVAYSGGVDSSYAAELCRDAGLETELVTMNLIPGDASLAIRAEERAEKAGFRHHTLDLQDAFKEKVMHRVWLEYTQGRTPNPCALCNPLFKFGALREFALSRDCVCMVTGHYARILRTPDGRIELRQAFCRAKDQSYFLFGVPPEALAYCRTPLGGLEKSQVAAMAAERNLPAANDRESQDVCFAQESLPDTLSALFPEPPCRGWFVDETGKRLAPHKGIQFYTIGQRKGTGVPMGVPAYVSSINAVSGNIVLATDPARLFRDTLFLESCRWMQDLPAEFECQVRIRYRTAAVPALVRKPSGDRAEVRFASPVRAAAEGQAGVCFADDLVLGGGWIRFKNDER